MTGPYIDQAINDEVPRPDGMPGRKEPEEERRDAILRAAYVVATRERLGGVTARAVAAEAGVSSGLVFF